MRKYNLKKFELSQSYLFYWDKLEKANWFFEQIIDTVHEDLDGRLVQALMDAPVGDGGQWDMVAVSLWNCFLCYSRDSHMLTCQSIEFSPQIRSRSPSALSRHLQRPE